MGKGRGKKALRKRRATRPGDELSEQVAELVVPLSLLMLASRRQLRAMRSRLVGNA